MQDASQRSRRQGVPSVQAPERLAGVGTRGDGRDHRCPPVHDNSVGIGPGGLRRVVQDAHPQPPVLGGVAFVPLLVLTGIALWMRGAPALRRGIVVGAVMALLSVLGMILIGLAKYGT